ncbi:B12-binding domain-containing protein [Acetobacterium bakii]|uniref:B12-binding domain-containing protein n=1 Tax=Acetobacterium bakii TaxID=52689 RepID=UPI00068010D4|nr:B12-binding domain-containing protein [Acetobacterium bakii]
MDLLILTSLMRNLEEEEIMKHLDNFVADNPTKDQGIEVIKACQKGTKEVGMLFEKGEYFAGDILFAGKLLKEAKDKLHPIIGDDVDRFKSGCITLGFVYGDTHDKGEEIFERLVKRAGFVVINPQFRAS